MIIFCLEHVPVTSLSLFLSLSPASAAAAPSTTAAAQYTAAAAAASAAAAAAAAVIAGRSVLSSFFLLPSFLFPLSPTGQMSLLCVNLYSFQKLELLYIVYIYMYI